MAAGEDRLKNIMAGKSATPRRATAILAASLLASSVSAGGLGAGTAQARCRANESGPAIMVDVRGLKDRSGTLRLELYPDDAADFLADDTKLVGAGKTFRRVIVVPPAQGDPTLCIRTPSPGRYALALIHDRDGKPNFSIWHDGIGVPGNPSSLHGSPTVDQARVTVGSGIIHSSITMTYRRGLFSFAPLQ